MIWIKDTMLVKIYHYYVYICYLLLIYVALVSFCDCSLKYVYQASVEKY